MTIDVVLKRLKDVLIRWGSSLLTFFLKDKYEMWHLILGKHEQMCILQLYSES